MKVYSCILFFLLLWSGVAAQTYTYTTSRFKGSYGDGQDRSAHSYVLEKVKAPSLVCEGDTAVFSIGYEGTFACDFKWRKVGDSQDSWCDSSVMQIQGVGVEHRGKYYCCLVDMRSGAVRYSDTVELKVRKRPTALIGDPEAPFMLCYGDSTTLNAIASENDKETGDTYTYSWEGPNIKGNSNLPDVTVAPRESATYVVTVNNDGCRAQAELGVEVYRPQVDIPAVIYLAQDQPLKLEPEIPATAVLDWTIGSTVVPGTNSLVFDGIDQTTNIRVKMTDRTCVAVDSGVVYFKRGRGYKGGFQDGFDRSDHSVVVGKIKYPESVCEGEKAVFSIDYEGTFACDYEWRKVGSNEVWSDTAMLTLDKASIDHRGKYFCKLIDISSGKTFFSDTVELKVRKRPTAVIGNPVSPHLICYGDTITLNASASEIGKEEGDVYSYSWSGEGIISNSNLSLVRVSPKVTTVYTVTVSNAGCSADTTVEIISYRPVVDLPDYVYISEGNTLELSVDVPDAAKLIWTAEGNVFEDINPFTYPDIRKTMEVTVKMLNEGCEASDKCKVYVKRGRGYRGGDQDGFDRSCNAPVILNQNRSEASCVATGAELWVQAEGSSPEYIWRKFNDETKKFEEYVPATGSYATGLGTWKLTFDQLIMEDNGVYLCEIRNACGSVTTDTFSLSVGGLPVLKSGLNRDWDQCVNGQEPANLNVAALDPQGKELEYSWYKVDTVRNVYTLLQDPAQVNQPYLKLNLSDKERDEGVYLVNIHNECGDVRDSVFIPVNMPLKIVASEEMKKKITACVGGAAEFSVETTGGGKVRYRLAKVNVISRFPLQYTVDYDYIGGSKITVDRLTKADEGIYVWEVDNGCGRDTSDLIELKVETPPVVGGIADTTELCAGQSVTFNCEATSPFSELTYEWFKNGVSTGVKGPALTVNAITVAASGNYVCYVSNSCPAVEGPFHRLEVKDVPAIPGRPYLKDSYCEGDSIELKVELGSASLDSVRWFLGGKRIYDVPGRISGTATAFLKLDSITVKEAGVYQIQAYNGCGGSRLSDGAKLVVDIPARFIKDLSGYTDLVLCDGDNQSLTVDAEGTAPIRYIWTHNGMTIAEGFSSTIQLNQVTADTAGLYCCEIQNRCGGKVMCAEIKVSHPDTFRLVLNAPADEVCAGDPDGLSAVLMGSDTNTLYSLYKEPGVLVTQIHGKDVAVPGGFIEFTGLMGGTYYVIAEDTRYSKACSYRMPGNVVITEHTLPKEYDLLVESHFCKDQHQATLALYGSERDPALEYGLYKLDGSSWIPYLSKVTGTGDTIRWSNVPEGYYKVIARNVTTGCETDMNHIEKVEEHALPQLYDLIARDGDSVYCANIPADVTLQLSGTESETVYTLYQGTTVYRSASAATIWNQVEAGTYHVEAMNKWGCRVEMGHQQVIRQQPPRLTSITGGTVFCENQSGTARVEIKNTDPATLYRVYREAPKTAYMDTMGNGGSIVLEVPLEDRTYYVIAEDTTAEHCRTALADTAVFKMSRLKVEGNPVEHYIWNGETCSLPVQITGREGELTIRWYPADLLQPGDSVKLTPTTVPVTERIDYTVVVKDYSACMATATISVIVKSDKLDCDIREADRTTSPDTVRVCEGADINLYAWVDGGTGEYQYTWRDLNATVGSEQLLQGYSRTTDGWLWLDVKSAEITKSDSVWVKVYANPAAFTLEPAGLLCVQKNTEVRLGLDGAEAGMRYVLSYSTDNARFNNIDTIAYTGGALQFTVQNAYVQEGYYAIRAEYPHELLTCRLPMADTLEVRKGAELYNLSGSRSYCEGGQQKDTIRLDKSQAGVVYTLYRKAPLQAIASLTGDNQELVFAGDWGTGEYFVTAQHTVCADTMNGRVTIVRNRRPADLGIAEKGSYCEGACPAQFTVKNAEAGVDYVLIRKNYGVADEELERLSGPGQLVFAQHCEAGEYGVRAETQDGCDRIFADRVKIAAALVDVNIEGTGAYCDAETGYEGTLKITNPQDGVTYQVLTEADGLKGTFDSVATDALYFRGLLEAGTYKVKAVAGSCSLDMVQTVEIEKLTRPSTNVLQPPYTLCQGDGELTMSVQASSGYHYELFRDSAGVVTAWGSKAGVNGSLVLGKAGSYGDYYVDVVHDGLGCRWRLDEQYHIDKPLQEFGITGDTLYCASDGGVVIGMDSTENAVEYVLQKWDEVYREYKEVDRLTGKGMPVAFKGYFPAGEYQVQAVRGCEKLMRGTLTVKSKAVPADSTEIVLEGNGCIDSTIVIRLQKPEPEVAYTLYFNGEPYGEVLSGTDLYWSIDKAKEGTYKITADKDGCRFVFPEQIEIGGRPFILPLQGDTLLCANRYGELFMEDWDRKAVYTLYTAAGEKIGTGAESGGKLYFSAVPVGDCYAVASRGNCEVQGELFTIDSIAVPELPEDFWIVSECVDRGEGEIRISGMADTLRYVLTTSSGRDLLDYKGEKSDTAFYHLDFDRYCVFAEDKVNNCRSDEWCATISESVAADSLVGDFAYCSDEAGVELRLSGSQRDMVYQIWSQEGDLLEEIRNGATAFTKRYKRGEYVFRKERTGILGGCVAIDTFRIDSFAYPATQVNLEIIGAGASLCEKSDYTLELKNTEAGYEYMLIKDPGASSEQYVDTLRSSGGVQAFPKKLSGKGFYRIYVQAQGAVCGAYLDTMFRIYGVPKPVTAEGCSYCVAVDEQDSCTLKISNLAAGVRYLLDRGIARDTVYGPGQKVLGACTAGAYTIIGEDMATGCRDTVAEAEVKAYRKPKLFTVGTVCDVAGEIRTIDGSEGDTVKYYLYKEGAEIAGPIAGTGASVSFGIYTDYGVYKVKAVSDKGCESWMRDSAIIYTPLGDTLLTQKGFYCKEGSTGVTIQYAWGNYGWNYYLRKGPWYSDTLKGEEKELVWTKIEGHILSAGTYDLYAYNACGTYKLKSIEVKENPLPKVFKLEGTDEAICSGSGVEVILTGSEHKVTYELIYVSSGAEQELQRAAGTGGYVSMGSYSAVGQYIVYAVSDTSGCRVKMDEKMFYPGATPEVKRITGNDVCLNQAVNDPVALCVTGPLQQDVDYYLWYQGDKEQRIVDTVLSEATELCFTVQTDTGCYYVVARDVASGCENTMDGQYCAGLPPQEHKVIKTEDTVTLCRGEDYCVEIDGSENGVKYVLLKDGVAYGKPQVGIGWQMQVGCVTESGVYKVKAYVEGDCWLMMKDSIVVRVNELPGIVLQEEYKYCDLGEGVTLGVSKPTYAGFVYTLKAPDGTTLESRAGNADHEGFEFTVAGWQKLAGDYTVEVENEAGCRRTDTMKVIVNPLPEPFRLKGSNGQWLCLDGTAEIYLDSTQKEIEYHLYRKRTGDADVEVGKKYGTGKSLTLATVNAAGDYYVEGVNFTTGCKNNMLNGFTLTPADTVKVYRLKGLRTGYCYTAMPEEKGMVELAASQKGVTYELYRDGVATGRQLPGTGGALVWNELEGMPCSNRVNTNDVGYVYEVLARDTLTGCESWMNGKIGIVEESEPDVPAWHPNSDILKCRGERVNFSLSATGCNLRYVWKREGVVVKDSTEEFYNIDSVTVQDFGAYHCEVSNSCGTISTPSVELKFRDSLSYLQRMQDKAVCGNVGETVVLNGYIQNGRSYEWYKVGDETPLSYSEWYKIRAVTPEHAGFYVFRAENECGILTDTMELKVDADPSNEPVLFRTDTICAGTPYLLNVVSSDTVKWYKDGVFTGITGNDFILNAAQPADEGLYSVRVLNACAPEGKAIQVAQLYVDDTIKIVAIRPSELVCENTTAYLYINTKPDKRVEYVWETGGTVVARGQNFYQTGVLTSDEPEYTYWVSYRNKCTDKRASIRLTVSNKLEYEDPVEQVLMCAESGKDTAIYVTHPATLIASYQWYWQEFRESADPVKLEGEVYDTLHLSAATRNIGYYYCVIGKVCNPVTTHSCWFRVDTVPVLAGQLEATDTTCENSRWRIELSAMGGGLTYEWNFLLKDGTKELQYYENALLASTGYYETNRMETKYDSSRIWCRVFNGCGEVTSDTLLLRVKAAPKVRLVPSDTAVCRFSTPVLQVVLENGKAPWRYSYRYNGGALSSVSSASLCDTLVYAGGGRYVIEKVETDGCELSGTLAEVEVSVLDATRVRLLRESLSDTLCSGDTLMLRLEIEGGSGSWEIGLRKAGGDIAEDISADYPFTLGVRSRLLSVGVYDDTYYYVDSVRDLNSTSACLPVYGDTVRVWAEAPSEISLHYSGSSHVGSCRVLNLDSLLRPSPLGGAWYVNGVESDSLWSPRGPLDTVRYEMVSDRGCVSYGDLVFVVDSLPSAEVIVPEVSCGTSSDTLRIAVSPAVQDYRVRLRQTRYRRGGGSRVDVRDVVVPVSSGCVYAEELKWSLLDGQDSCLLYDIVEIEDSHGCLISSSSATLGSGQVYWHPSPLLSVLCRLPGAEGWSSGPHVYEIARGDSVEVRVERMRGAGVWSLPSLGMGSIYGDDTVFFLKDAGIHYVEGEDLVCGSLSVRDSIEIRYMQDGYLRGRLWLEGPYDGDNHMMHSLIGDKLGLPSVSSLPALPSGSELIDWVVLEVRSGSDVDSVAQLGGDSRLLSVDSCLLLSDGRLADRHSGDTLVLLSDGYRDSSVYLVVRHRNHLDVMSSGRIMLGGHRDGSDAPMFDFTQEGNVYRRESDLRYHMSRIGGVWLLSAGELNRNQFITLYDPNEIAVENLTDGGVHAYDVQHDVNFDGRVDWPGWSVRGVDVNGSEADWNIVRRNRQKYSAVK